MKKTPKSLLTCPDSEFKSRFDALWDSLKDENGQITMNTGGVITADTLYIPEDSLVKSDKLFL